MQWSEQIAVVTGASGGIGRAIALLLAARGAGLCLAGRNLHALEEVAIAASTAAFVDVYEADLTVDAELQAWLAHLDQTVPHVNMLVHSAGVITLGAWVTTPVGELDRQYRLNVRVPFLLTQALLLRLKVRQGQVVFVNSSAGIQAGANAGAYAATKHALKALADSLRAEHNADSLRVISVYPGRTASPMQAAVHAAEGKAYWPERLLQPEDVATVVVNALALPRTAEVTDLHIRPMQKAG